MPSKLECRKFIFMLEGATERSYLEWLQKQINNSKEIAYKAKFVFYEKNPSKLCRTISITNLTQVYAIIDTERYSELEKFKSFLTEMKKAPAGKQIVFKLGYSNITFELWIILHKVQFNQQGINPDFYLEHINKAYGTNFESLTKYKHEREFRKILENLSIKDVIYAIKNAEIMEKNNQENFILENHRGFEYYKENPSLSIHHIIKKVFTECGIML